MNTLIWIVFGCAAILATSFGALVLRDLVQSVLSRNYREAVYCTGVLAFIIGVLATAATAVVK